MGKGNRARIQRAQDKLDRPQPLLQLPRIRMAMMMSQMVLSSKRRQKQLFMIKSSVQDFRERFLSLPTIKI